MVDLWSRVRVRKLRCMLMNEPVLLTGIKVPAQQCRIQVRSGTGDEHDVSSGI
jgi:hypothetical protein